MNDDRSDQDFAPRAKELSSLTVNEFCREYRIGRTKFYAEIKAGELAISKIGTKTVITPEQQMQWLRRKSEGARVLSEKSPMRRGKGPGAETKEG